MEQQSCQGMSWKAFLSVCGWFHLVCSAQHKTESMGFVLQLDTTQRLRATGAQTEGQWLM